MNAAAKRSGMILPLKDSFVAAAAHARGLTVATRNVADFERANVAVVNPFDEVA